MQLFSGKTDKSVVFSLEVASFLSLAVLYARFGAKCAEFRRHTVSSGKIARKKRYFSTTFRQQRRFFPFLRHTCTLVLSYSLISF
ncbi:MAG: hypothetical protein ACI4V3_07415 [Faecousia sp.]